MEDDEVSDVTHSLTALRLGAVWGYSRAVRVGNRIEVSGTAAWNPDGTAFAPDDPYAQSHEIFRTIAGSLSELGASLADVVRTRAFLVEISDWPEVARVHSELFGSIRPASTCLGGVVLLNPHLRVEIEASAIVASR